MLLRCHSASCFSLDYPLNLTVPFNWMRNNFEGIHFASLKFSAGFQGKEIAVEEREGGRGGDERDGRERDMNIHLLY